MGGPSRGIEKTKFIWLDGKFVGWDEAQIHVLTHTLHYGLGIFEGIRYYRCLNGRSALFRQREHWDRFFHSGRIMGVNLPYPREQLQETSAELIRRNGLEEGYLRPIAFIGSGAMGLHAIDNPVRMALVTWSWGAYLGEEGLKHGIRAKVSSFPRHHPGASMTKAKITGAYVNSILAKREAMAAGYDEAIMLDTGGFVAEASGENVFAVRDGRLKTPPLECILPGITRDSMIQIARSRQMEVEETRITRDELYMADEVFLTGTAAEITPVREIDNRPIGSGQLGPVTRELQQAFFNAARGRDGGFSHWLTYL